MGITIINNYEMPGNCYMCDLHNYHYCDLTGESIEEDYCYNGDSREKHCPLREVEAIPKAQYDELKANITMMRLDYEARLKADLVAMLTEIQLEVEEVKTQSGFDEAWDGAVKQCSEIIQQKIDKLKEAD